MFDMMGMMGRLKDLQEKMKQAQSELQTITATAEAGGGMVRATANGKRQLLKLEIDETLLTPQDKEMLADLVVAAVNKAMAEVDDKAKDHMKQRTQGLLPNIPGLDLSGFGL
jgi:DNA-binding YbaB/EbfC family protein